MAPQANNVIGRLGDAANRSKSKPDRYRGYTAESTTAGEERQAPTGGMLLAVLELPPSEVQSKFELPYGL